ncbi:ABC transporter G family member 23 [Cucumispora dikerogammari]|nr:ABC transporter G family member 23 [Cucumispora dikerogammari]
MYKFSNIKYQVKAHRILDNITINIPKNKVTMILGPSGSGKTTLLKMISGRINSKNLKLNDKRISSEALNKRTAFVYQHHHLPEELTVNEYFNFAYSCKMSVYSSESSQEQIDNLLTKLNAYEIKDKRIGNMGSKLSGGQLKRVELGVELISGSDILFVDEPLSGLDSYNSIVTMDLMKSFEKTVVLSVHQPSTSILAYCEHVIILNRTKVFFEGTLDELIEYINLLGYDYSNNDQINCCEFVFNNILLTSNDPDRIKNKFIYNNKGAAEQTYIFEEKCNISDKKSFLLTVLALQKRSFIQFYRNYKLGTVRFLQSLASAAFVVLIFSGIVESLESKISDLGSTKHQKSVNENDRLICEEYSTGAFLVFFIMLTSFMRNSIAGCSIFSRDFNLIIKEVSNNYYSISAYVLSTTIFEYLVSLFVTIIPYIIGLCFIGGNLGIRYKLGIVLGLIPCTLMSLSSMMLFSAFFYDGLIPFSFYPPYSILVLITAGLLTNNSNTLVSILFEKVNPLRYGMCLAIKFWITESSEKYCEGVVLLEPSYKTFFKIWQIILLSFVLLMATSLLFFLLFFWKVRNRRG